MGGRGGSGPNEYGNSPTCDARAVVCLGNQKSAPIWSKGLAEYSTSAETYADAREHTVQAATDLYGAGSPWA